MPDPSLQMPDPSLKMQFSDDEVDSEDETDAISNNPTNAAEEQNENITGSMLEYLPPKLDSSPPNVDISCLDDDGSDATGDEDDPFEGGGNTQAYFQAKDVDLEAATQPYIAENKTDYVSEDDGLSTQAYFNEREIDIEAATQPYIAGDNSNDTADSPVALDNDGALSTQAYFNEKDIDLDAATQAYTAPDDDHAGESTQAYFNARDVDLEAATQAYTEPQLGTRTDTAEEEAASNDELDTSTQPYDLESDEEHLVAPLQGEVQEGTDFMATQAYVPHTTSEKDNVEDDKIVDNDEQKDQDEYVYVCDAANQSDLMEDDAEANNEAEEFVYVCDAANQSDLKGDEMEVDQAKETEPITTSSSSMIPDDASKQKEATISIPGKMKPKQILL